METIGTTRTYVESITAVLYWRQAWSVWRKLYYSFLALCAVGYVAVLGANGLLTVLF
ncbi:MAG: hypothetical protein R6X34_24395 [Chloroflexota bacterium]